MSTTGHHFVLRISLAKTSPEIWRRIRIGGALPLTALHAAIQISMSWEAAHLYSFSFGADRYQASPLDEDELDVIKLADVAKKGDRFTYVYDFGDDWRHDVVVEDVVTPVGASQPILCLDGARAAPPEDCGGMPGFERILVGDAQPPPRWSADRFNVDAINAELEELFGVKDYRRADFVNEDGAPRPFSYDPDQPFDEASWDALSTDEKLWSVAAYHFWNADGDHPPVEILSAHALMHTTVELHVVSRSPLAAHEALDRLCAAGSSRHDALHKIADALDAAMLASNDSDPEAYKQAYIDRLESLN